MKHNGILDIATGMAADSRTWKNKKINWSDLVQRLSEEHRTTETFREYISATKEEQLKIKDVGGYVGGYLRNGRRKPENVLHRQLVTLDIDFAHANFWDDFLLTYGNAAVLHATHKHHENSPRYRLIMPLDREVSPDEYVAISRKIAGTLDIELFDSTTFETNRLMFWPSNPKDVDYFFRFQDGEFIEADSVLAEYVDWTDSSAWPTSERQAQKVRGTFEKQEDPELKKGIVGAFCRAYGIETAISEFLADVYRDANGDGRYTYSKGSTSGGLIIYDNKFAYSHHGTDPTSMKLCNAFDLVRLHKFGHLDADDSSGPKAKSFIEMEAFARADKEVRKVLAAERLDATRYDFAEALEDGDTDNMVDWMQELEVNGQGAYLASAVNLNLIFANDTRLKHLFRYNTFDNKRYIFHTAPWRKINKPEPVKNVDFSGVRNYIETIYGISSKDKINDVIALVFERHSFHPVRDYLRGLEWDGVHRIPELLIDIFGAEDNIYTREATTKMLVGAVARIFEPGVKFDLALVLVSQLQGTGKSSFFRALGRSWFSDSFVGVQGNASFEQLQGAWILEMSELAGLKKSEVEPVKQFLSKQEDTLRRAYAEIPETFLRQNIFVGSTNITGFLNDPSGGRRFMPIDIKNVKITQNEKLKSFIKDTDLVNSLWAEAHHLYKNGEPLYLSDAADAIADREQRAHREVDEREGLILTYLDTPLPANWDKKDIHDRRAYFTDPLAAKGREFRDYVCVAEIWCECLGKDKEDMDRYKTRELNDILRGLDGWEQSTSTRNFKLYGKQKFYVRSLD